MIRLKRVYEKVKKEDGVRILVDRLWPRGISRVEAKIDLWLKEIAPSNELRKWFKHDPQKWGDFQKKYKKELANKQHLKNEVQSIEKEKGTVTLIYAAKDTKHTHARVLKDFLSKK